MLEDPRNGLYRKFLEIVRDLQPKMVLIENVPNLLDFDGGKYRDETYQFLAESGYEIKSDVSGTVAPVSYTHLDVYKRQREYISSFRGIFKLKPGEKSVVQELLDERRAEKEKEDRE